MKSTPIEQIYSLRKKINFQTYLLLMLLACLAAFLFFLSVTRDSPFFTGAFAIGIPLILLFSYYIWKRKSELLGILNPEDPGQTLTSMTAVYERNHAFFRKRDFLRFMIGIALTAVMLFLFYFKRQSHWTGEVCVLWFGLILVSMAQAWLLMQEGMMIQDLKRSLRDDHSDIS